MPEYEVTYAGPSAQEALPVGVIADDPGDAVIEFNKTIGATVGEYPGERYLVNDLDDDTQVVVSVRGNDLVKGDL